MASWRTASNTNSPSSPDDIAAAIPATQTTTKNYYKLFFFFILNKNFISNFYQKIIVFINRILLL